MILAAGMGTRLGHLTEKLPKALIRVNKIPLIAHVINRLKNFGITEIIINVHHFAHLISEYLKKERNFGIHIELSHESVLLDTGGGLKNASWFFDDDHPFILHNVDVISDLNLSAMVEYHIKNKSLATLAVRARESSRYLLFNDDNLLIGWKSHTHQKMIKSYTMSEKRKALSFMGIHVISPAIFSMFPTQDTFSILDVYINCAAYDKRVIAFNANPYFWIDLGRPDRIAIAERYLRDKY